MDDTSASTQTEPLPIDAAGNNDEPEPVQNERKPARSIRGFENKDATPLTIVPPVPHNGSGGLSGAEATPHPPRETAGGDGEEKVRPAEAADTAQTDETGDTAETPVAVKALATAESAESVEAAAGAAEAVEPDQAAEPDQAPPEDNGEVAGLEISAAISDEEEEEERFDLDPLTTLSIELEEAKASALAFKEQLYRKAADLQNTKRRMNKQIQDMRRYGGEAVLKEMLPVVDDLERAIDHASRANQSDSTSGTLKVESFIDGVSMVLKKLTATLDRFGVRGFDSLVKPFDPQLHEAISKVETDLYPEGTVVAEYARGYFLHDRLMRPALVAVATLPAAPEAEPEAPPAPEPELEATAEEATSEEEAPLDVEQTVEVEVIEIDVDEIDIDVEGIDIDVDSSEESPLEPEADEPAEAEPEAETKPED